MFGTLSGLLEAQDQNTVQSVEKKPFLFVCLFVSAIIVQKNKAQGKANKNKHGVCMSAAEIGPK